jgi:hypothetical protein
MTHGRTTDRDARRRDAPGLVAPDATAGDTAIERATSPDEHPDGRVGDGRSRWRRADYLWACALVALAFSITLLGVLRATSFSLYDEATHVDYAWQIASGDLPYAGSQLAPEVLQEWSCRGLNGFEDEIPPCGESHDASEYPLRGENYNFGHPPTYYALTAGAAALGEALPVGVTFMTAARLTGAIWLAAALVGLYGVLRLWRVPRVLSAGSAALLAAVPSVAHASSIVTNDAPGALTGVLALWVLTRVAVQEKIGWLLPTVLAALVASTKVMNAVAMLAVAAVVLGLAVSAFRAGDRIRARAMTFIAVGIGGATAAVHLGWRAFQGGRGNPDWLSPVTGVNTRPTEGTPVDEWLPTLFEGFGIAQTFWLQASLSSFAVFASARLLALIMTTAPFVNVASFPAGDRRRLVGWAALVGCAVVPLIVQVQTYANGEDYFPLISGRYGISLLPLTIGALAFVAHARRWRVAPALVVGACLVALLASFTGLAT